MRRTPRPQPLDSETRTARPSRIGPHLVRRVLGPAIGLAIALGLAACATPPSGPPFELSAAPPEHRARLYLYRVDQRSSLSQIRVTLDGRTVGHFRDAEYETLELPAGSHHLRAGLRNLLSLAWGWNDQPVHLKPGETVFIELSARLTEHPTPPGRELEIAGRPTGGASENVYLKRVPETEALERIATTTRLAP